MIKRSSAELVVRGLFRTNICSFLRFCLLLSLPVWSLNRAAAAASLVCPTACLCIAAESPENPNVNNTQKAHLKIDNTTRISVNCSHADLPAWPEDLPDNVVVLILDGNKIKRLQNISTLSNATAYSQMTVLSARNNLLSQVNSGAFESFSSLGTLYLSYNMLTDLAWSASLANSRISVLDLSFNSIERISPSRLEPLKFLKR